VGAWGVVENDKKKLNRCKITRLQDYKILGLQLFNSKSVNRKVRKGFAKIAKKFLGRAGIPACQIFPTIESMSS
jgi:hypothetical protein